MSHVLRGSGQVAGVAFASTQSTLAMARVAYEAHKTKGNTDRVAIPGSFDNLPMDERVRWEWVARVVMLQQGQALVTLINATVSAASGARRGPAVASAPIVPGFDRCQTCGDTIEPDREAHRCPAPVGE